MRAPDPVRAPAGGRGRGRSTGSTRSGRATRADSRADREQSNDNFEASCVLQNKKVGIRAGDRGKGAGGPTRIIVTRDPVLTRRTRERPPDKNVAAAR